MSRPAIASRRNFLHGAASLVGLLATRGALGFADPTDYEPHATSGDTREPQWKERLTVSVSPTKGDLVGADDKVLQAAVDYVARLGGGTVHVLPGTYRLRNAVYLQSKVRLLGSGADSILLKEPSTSVKLADDSDWFDQEITLAGADGFQIGDGVCLTCKNPHNSGTTVVKRTLVARDGQRFKLDRALRENFWRLGESTAATLFPLLSGENIADVAIENITLDGNRDNNANLNGNYAGCIFLQDCNRISMREVTARNYNGDGMSWQICHDAKVENCHSHDNADLGLHPGSGSQRPVIRNNKLERNNIGIFFCWGVKGGLAEHNTIDGNRSYGVSIGHHDNNNWVRDNDILRSGKVGVLFRPERGATFAGHRNRIEGNRIVDSGDLQGIGIDVQGETESIALVKNQLRETRGAAQRTGIRISEKARQIDLIDNTIQGFATSVADLRA